MPAFVAAGFACLALIQSPRPSATEDLGAVRRAATARIEIAQSIEAPDGKPITSVNLPYRPILKMLLESAGVKVVETGEAELVVRVTARAFTKTIQILDGDRGVRYPDAWVEGAFSFKLDGAEVLRQEFAGKIVPDSFFRNAYREPDSAPFRQAFLGDPSWTKDSYVAQALKLTARIYGPPGLIAALGPYREATREFGGATELYARVLAETRDERTVETLIGLLQDHAAAGAAAAGLGELRDARAIDPLIALLSSDAACVAAESLAKIGGARATDALIAHASQGDKGCTGRVILKLQDPRVFDALVAGLKGPRGSRIESARALGQIADRRAVEPLIDALSDSDEWVRREAADALAIMPDPRAVDPLILCLKHRSDSLREAAARTLGKIGDPRAFEPLLAALEDKDWSVRRAAEEALAGMPDLRPVPVLVASLRKGDKQAVRVIRARKDPSAVPLLLAALPDANKCEAAIQALGVFKEPAVTDALLEKLNDPDRDVRYAVLKSLEEIGDARAIEPLIELLKTDHGYQNVIDGVLYTLTGARPNGSDYEAWSKWRNKKGKRQRK